MAPTLFTIFFLGISTSINAIPAPVLTLRGVTFEPSVQNLGFSGREKTSHVLPRSLIALRNRRLNTGNRRRPRYGSSPSLRSYCRAQSDAGARKPVEFLRELNDQSRADKGGANAAYIHVPFCRRRCFYCDFAISIVGDNRAKWETEHDKYLQAIRSEIQSTPSELGGRLETVFFGGGTPSLAPPSFIKEVLAALDERYGIADGAEISMEMDPGTFDLEKIKGFLDAGVNRVSLGVQTFDDDLLSSIGRAHNTTEVYNAIQILKEAGVENFSMDLISGLPDQRFDKWRESVDVAVRINPPHIAIYDLMVEEKTAFSKWGLVPGEPPLPSEEETTRMYRYSSKALQDAGYKHYEVSNYAKPGFECRHNRVYWENRPFLAFGMGAASYLDGTRFTRPGRLRDYLNYVDEIQETGWRSVVEREKTGSDFEQRYNELTDRVMLGLRLKEGLDLLDISREYGEDAVNAILKGAKSAIDNGNAILERTAFPSRTPRNLRLTDPDGFLLSSFIIADIFARLTSVNLSLGSSESAFDAIAREVRARSRVAEAQKS